MSDEDEKQFRRERDVTEAWHRQIPKVPSEGVEAMTRHAEQAPTADLEEFIAAYFEDDNIWWQIGCGHHMNLFDAAVERIRELEEELRARDHLPGGTT